MKIAFQFTGQLATAAGTSERVLELDAEDISASKAVAELAREMPEAFGELLSDASGDLRTTVLVILNGIQVDPQAPDAVVENGDQLMLMTPIAGG